MRTANIRRLAAAAVALVTGAMVATVATAGASASASSGSSRSSASSASSLAPAKTAVSPYDAAVGEEIVTLAAAIAHGKIPWARPCAQSSSMRCVPYSWGAGHRASAPGPSLGNCTSWSGPGKCIAPTTYGLDCSGYTRWVYFLVYDSDVLGYKNTASQVTQHEVEKVPASDARPGDLVYYPPSKSFPGGHIGIYAGLIAGVRDMYDAPHTYDKVQGQLVQAFIRLDKVVMSTARYYRYAGKPAGPVRVVPTDGIGYQGQGGSVPDLAAGPGGKVWLVARNPRTKVSMLQAVNPATDAISSYPLADKSLGTLTYNGEIAADGKSDLWLSATKPSGAGVVIRYTPATRKLTEFGTPKTCNGAGIYTEVTLDEAANGDVWLSCLTNSDNSVVERIAPGGQASDVDVPSQTPEVAQLVPGTGGSMWAVAAGGGVVELSPSGTSTPLVNNVTDNVIDISGNGSGNIVTVNQTFDNPPDNTNGTAFFTLDPSGTETLLAKAHQYEGYNSFMALQPTMATNGTVWQLVDVATLEPSGGQYYFEVTPAGQTKAYKLVIPKSSDVKLGLSPVGPPVITANGVLWEEEAAYPGTGELVRFTP